MNRFSVLFVCMGNICRSPTGEGVFAHYLETQGLSARFHIDSAGTIDYHAGNRADARMRAAAAQRGYSLDSISRQVRAQDIDEFDLILAMDADNLRDLEHLAGGPQAHILKFGTFVPGARDLPEPADVPDPYYGGAEGFDEVINMIESACDALAEYCLERMANQSR